MLLSEIPFYLDHVTASVKSEKNQYAVTLY